MEGLQIRIWQEHQGLRFATLVKMDMKTWESTAQGTDGSRAWVPGGRVRVHAHSPHTHLNV